MNEALKTPTTPVDGLSGTRLLFAAISIYIGMICANLDMVILQNALPTLTRDLQVDSATAVWVVTLYMLVMLVFLLPLSSLSDRIGYKRTYLWGFGMFTVASLGCGFATSFFSLQAWRGVQGLGAAAMMCSTTSLIRVVYPRARMARAIGANATVVAVSLAAGPSIAALILEQGSWHWLFWVNVPLGALALLVGNWALPANPVQLSLGRGQGREWLAALRVIDLRSFVLSAAFFIALVLGSGRIDVAPLQGAGVLALAVLLGYAFVRRERRSAVPMLPLDLLGQRHYGLTILTSYASFAAQGAAFVALPFYLQHGLGFSLAESALVMTAWPFSLALAAPVAARLTQRLPISHVCGAGLFALAAGLLSIASGWLPATPALLAVPLAICGAGFGMFQAPNNYLIIAAAPANRSGAVGGLRAVTRTFGQMSGTAAVGLLLALQATLGVNGAILGLFAAAALAASAGYASVARGGAGT
ncbi:MFS transporter [Pseudomonas sp. HR96]|uniref:MFS transporter n=1 Tax=Pseudomonas sp. HR96 TaxID=1027966 RepID=UPI002A764D6C|nr:MFS transporter [Pseudomonas sp. HR96]WPO98373.1 MFS transporter [Pseudomonas sp. HR96]